MWCRSVCSYLCFAFFCLLYSVIWSNFCSSQFFDPIFCTAFIVYSVKRYPNFVSLKLFICILTITNGSSKVIGFDLSVQDVIVECRHMRTEARTPSPKIVFAEFRSKFLIPVVIIVEQWIIGHGSFENKQNSLFFSCCLNVNMSVSYFDIVCLKVHFLN